MAKNPFDKYYTQETEIKKTMELVRKHIPLKEITEIIEPAAGDGAFIPEIKKLAEELKVPYKFYDLYPEHPEVETKDFKDLVKELEYKKGRLFIGNPPFGNASSLFKRFRNGAMEKGDWAVYIGPASHWNMKWGLKGMELVDSVHLGGVEYRGLENKKVNTCCNVYKRISGNIVDRRMEMLERDFEITNLINAKKENKHKSKWNNPEVLNYDYFICSYGDKVGEFHSLPYLGSYLCIKNKSKKNIEIWLKQFRERYLKEINKIQNGTPGFTIPWFKQKMIEEFYPTREEMLERDFEIKSIFRTKDLIQPECDYLIRADDGSNSGKLVKDIYQRPLSRRYISIKTKKDIKIFLETLREKEKEYFEKYIPKSGGTKKMPDSWLKQKMIEEFYPTREEMLERDFEINCRVQRATNNIEYDYYLANMATKATGKICNKEDYAWAVGIKVLQENKRKSLEIFLKEFYNKYFNELRIKEGPPFINNSWLKQKMIEHFYSDIPEYFGTLDTLDNELKEIEKDIKITKPPEKKENRYLPGHYFSYFGDGVAGLYTTDPTQWEIVWEIKVLNKEIEKDIVYFLKNFRNKYFEEIKDLSSTSTASISMEYFKKKLYEYLYVEDKNKEQIYKRNKALTLF